jgi:hypothetical protein
MIPARGSGLILPHAPLDLLLPGLAVLEVRQDSLESPQLHGAVRFFRQFPQLAIRYGHAMLTQERRQCGGLGGIALGQVQPTIQFLALGLQVLLQPGHLGDHHLPAIEEYLTVLGIFLHHLLKVPRHIQRGHVACALGKQTPLPRLGQQFERLIHVARFKEQPPIAHRKIVKPLLDPLDAGRLAGEGGEFLLAQTRPGLQHAHLQRGRRQGGQAMLKTTIIVRPARYADQLDVLELLT